MAAPSEAKILRTRKGARVIVDPTDLSDTSDYGGTEIGSIKNIAWATGQRYVPVIGEELGGPVDFARVEDSFAVSMMLRQFDATALAAVFRSVATGGSGDPVVSFPATRSSGDDGLMLGERRVVLIAANIATDPSLILYSALGIEDDQAKVRMSNFAETAIPAVFLGVKDSSGRIAKFGRVEDLTL